MKTVLKKYSTTKQAQIFTALVLTGILSVGSGLTLQNSATATPKDSLPKAANEVLKGNIKTNSLPQPVARAVLRDLSRKQGILPTRFKIIEYSQQTWRNGCLDLPKSDELCTQALVPGWRVVVSDNNQTWIYHTNKNGRSLRLANADTPTNNQSSNLPKSVKNAVLKAASKRLNTPISQLNIIEAQKRTWSDGCLELGGPAESCLQALVEGWRVVVGTDDQILVYHTDDSGSNLRLNEQESKISDNKLPEKVSNAILKVASQDTGLRISQLRIVDSKQITTDGCLGLPRPDEVCTQIAQKAWEVTVQARRQRLVYRANQDGSQVRLNKAASRISLPKPITNAVLRDASQWSGLPTSRLRIVKSDRHTWGNPCEVTFNQICNKAYIPTPGWIVTVDSGAQQWVYHVNEDASIVALDRTRSLSETAAKAIKQDAVKRSQKPISTSALRIIEVQRLADWNGTCEGNSNCTRPISGWQATVSNGQQSWVYRVKEDGSQFEYQTAAANLPESITNAVLADASEESGLPFSRLRVVEVERREWPDRCLGISEPLILCAPSVVTGWRVIVSDGQQRLVYRVGEPDVIKFDKRASEIADKGNSPAVPISSSELPPALESGMVFRQISSGGFAGRTYETILLGDGHLIRVRIGDANDSERSVRRVSPQQLRKFQQLLKKEGGQFQNLNYPAPTGAADYITYTLTNSEGTVQYNDISQNRLPKKLQVLLKEWNQIVNSAQGL